MAKSDLIGKRTYEMLNGRHFPRLKANYLLKFIPVTGDLREQTFVVNTKDISLGGLRFYGSQKMEKETLVRIQLLVPPLDATILAFARVCRVETVKTRKQYLISFSFVEMSKNDCSLLNQVIENCLQTKEAFLMFDHRDVVKRRPKLETV